MMDQISESVLTLSPEQFPEINWWQLFPHQKKEDVSVKLLFGVYENENKKISSKKN